MNWLGDLRRRLQFLFHRKRFEQDLAEEMNLHLELRAAESSPAARQRFGNLTRLAEIEPRRVGLDISRNTRTGCPLRPADAGGQSGLYGHGGALAGAGHRRKHRHI